MAFCTIVEWETGVDFGGLGEPGKSSGIEDALPEGCLSRIVGQLNPGACVIEVWESGADAKRFSERTAPKLSGSAIPPPTRVVGFETQVYR